MDATGLAAVVLDGGYFTKRFQSLHHRFPAVDDAKGERRRSEDQEEEPRQARQERTRASSRPDLSNEKAPNSSTSQADSIRHHALRHYVEPWRNTKEQRLSICAGDVQRELNLHGVAPNVCNALGGRKFLELADLKLIVHTKPCPSTTTVFFYERAQ